MWLLRLGVAKHPRAKGLVSMGVTHSFGIFQAEGQDEREGICQELM